MSRKRSFKEIRKSISERCRNIFYAVFSFSRGNFWDKLFRVSAVGLIFIAVGIWLGQTFTPPVVEYVEQPATQIESIVRSQIHSILEQEYPWILEDSLVSARVTPPEPERPDPTEYRPSEEVLSASFARILWPLNGEVVTSFGWNRHPIYQDWRFHGGLELEANGSGDVRTVLPGRVRSVRSGMEGTEVVINHGSGWQTLYRSVEAVAIQPGDSVEQNQTIGVAGSNNRVFFGLTHEDEPVNPLTYLQ